MLIKRRGWLLAMICIFAVPTAPTLADETVVAELTARLHYFLANSGLESAHAQFWAEDLVYTSSNGTRFGKADIMRGFAATEDDTADETADDAAITVFTGEDVKVKAFGSTAIVTFKLVGTPGDGSATLNYYNSGTFLKRRGEWRVVNWQATIIPTEP